MKHALAIVVVATGCANAPSRRIEVAPPIAASSAPAAKAPSPAVRLVHRERFDQSPTAPPIAVLFAIDRARRRAYVEIRSANTGAAPYRAFDTIDLETGERIDRWEATPANASTYAPYFSPLDGTFAHDLVRVAKMVRAGGPWFMTASPWIAVSPDGAHILYDGGAKNQDVDWLFVANAEGENARRLDLGMVASYEPVVSPDSRYVAWKACTGSMPCAYALEIAALDAPKAKPARLESVPNPADVSFSVDGSTVYATTTPDWKRSCLVAVDRVSLTRKDLFCEDGTFLFRESRDGQHAMVQRTTTPQGVVPPTMELSWIALPGASDEGRHTIPRATVASRPSDSGKALVDVWSTSLGKIRIAAVDVAADREVSLDLDVIPSSAQILEGDVFLATGYYGHFGDADQGYTLVSIDAAALLAQ